MITWTDVPDPRDDNRPCHARCEVSVEERTWRHIVERHVTSSAEPWDEWLTPAVADRLRTLWSHGSTEQVRRDTLGAVATTVEMDVKSCLNVPLGLLYDDYKRASPVQPSKAQETWGLVLPCGAFLVARSRPTGGEVRTCYFKGVASRETDPSQRWRRLAQSVMITYAKVRPDGTFGPPDRLDIVTMDNGFRTRIRFRTDITWMLDGTSRQPWDTLADPWLKHLPPSPPAISLRPRRSY